MEHAPFRFAPSHPVALRASAHFARTSVLGRTRTVSLLARYSEAITAQLRWSARPEREYDLFYNTIALRRGGDAATDQALLRNLDLYGDARFYPFRRLKPHFGADAHWYEEAVRRGEVDQEGFFKYWPHYIRQTDYHGCHEPDDGSCRWARGLRVEGQWEALWPELDLLHKKISRWGLCSGEAPASTRDSEPPPV